MPGPSSLLLLDQRFRCRTHRPSQTQRGNIPKVPSSSLPGCKDRCGTCRTTRDTDSFDPVPGALPQAVSRDDVVSSITPRLCSAKPQVVKGTQPWVGTRPAVPAGFPHTEHGHRTDVRSHARRLGRAVCNAPSCEPAKDQWPQTPRHSARLLGQQSPPCESWYTSRSLRAAGRSCASRHSIASLLITRPLVSLPGATL